MKIFGKIKKRNRKENSSDEEIQMIHRNPPILNRKNSSSSSNSNFELLTEVSEEARDQTIESSSDETYLTYNVAYAGLNQCPGRDSKL